MKIFHAFLLAFFVVTSLVPSNVVYSATVKKVTTVTAKKKVEAPKKTTQLLLASETALRLTPGETVQLRFGFKNTGKPSWKVREMRLVGGDGALFATSSWATTSTPVTISGQELKTGRLEFFDIAVQAPEQVGSFQIKLGVFADGEAVQGGSIIIPAEVINSESAEEVSNVLLPEPRIRVALGKVDSSASIKISAGQYSVNLLDGTQIGAMSLGDTGAFEYDTKTKVYSFKMSGAETVTSTLPFRLLADSSECRFVLTDKKDVAKWNKSIVYNEYRDSFELRWSDKIVGLWMINELPIEHYLKGLVETGNSEPYELQKAVYTAARTYAYIYLPTATTPERMWDVHSVWDQVYKGYAAEKSNPNGSRAVEETRGTVVTYEHKPVVTPYFTRSNGMTRGWKSVWGGKDKPWLIPVVASYDAGKKMLGHGVGMSTLDAKARVQKDGWNFDQVLTYYYTGVLLEKVYN